MRNLLRYTWIALRHHDWMQEPAGQRKAREAVLRQIHRLEYDPATQWKYHLRMSWFWLGNLPIATVWLTVFHDTWESLGVYYVAILSIYANFVSDYTGVHAAWAALRGDQIMDEAERDKMSEIAEDLVDP